MDNAIAVIWRLVEKWPACFVMHERGRRPLKVGI
jgi:sRNA-binding protein